MRQDILEIGDDQHRIPNVKLHVVAQYPVIQVWNNETLHYQVSFDGTSYIHDYCTVGPICEWLRIHERFFQEVHEHSAESPRVLTKLAKYYFDAWQLREVVTRNQYMTSDADLTWMRDTGELYDLVSFNSLVHGIENTCITFILTLANSIAAVVNIGDTFNPDAMALAGYEIFKDGGTKVATASMVTDWLVKIEPVIMPMLYNDWDEEELLECLRGMNESL